MKLDLKRSFGVRCECPADGLDVRILSLGGHVCTVTIDCQATIGDVKNLIHRQTRIAAHEQHILATNFELVDSEKLAAHLPSRQGVCPTLMLIRRDPMQAEWLQGLADGRLCLTDAPLEIRGNREVVLEAIRMNPSSLEVASEELRGDREIALLAVRLMGGKAIRLLSPQLRADRELVWSAVRHAFPEGALAHACDELRFDRGFVLAIVRRHGFLIAEAPYHFQEDPEIALSALQDSRLVLGECSCCFRFVVALRSELLQNKDFVLSAVLLGRHDVLERAPRFPRKTPADHAFTSKLLSSIDLTLGIPCHLVSAGLRKKELSELHPKEATEFDLCRGLRREKRRSFRQAGKRVRQCCARQHQKRGGRHKAGEHAISCFDFDLL